MGEGAFFVFFRSQSAPPAGLFAFMDFIVS